MKTLFQKDTCAPMFTAALFTKAKTWKQLYVPQQRNGERSCVCVCVSTYLYQYIMEYHSAIKKNETMLIAATWMDLEITSKSDREREISYDITYMWNLKNDSSTNIFTKPTDTENKLMVIKGEADKLAIWD